MRRIAGISMPRIILGDLAYLLHLIGSYCRADVGEAENFKLLLAPRLHAYTNSGLNQLNLLDSIQRGQVAIQNRHPIQWLNLNCERALLLAVLSGIIEILLATTYLY